MQSFYAINDKGVIVNKQPQPLTGGGLIKQSILDEINKKFRTVSSLPVNYTGTDSSQGWYINLSTPSGTAEGERATSAAVLRFGRIVFVTIIPSPNACTGGGISWLMEMNAINGQQLDAPPFDTTGDNIINSSDTIVAGLKPEGGITTTPAIVDGDDSETTETKALSLSNAEVLTVRESSNKQKFSTRQSWRQLQ
jgi:type IV pilus assembly protein PilY1